MKRLLFALLLFASFAASAQDVDSSAIQQTITLPQHYLLYIISHMPSRGAPQAINFLNQVRAQLDTTVTDKPITVTVSSGFIRDRFSEMAQVPEGEANQYNTDMLPLLGSQITNPWLGNAVGEIRNRNWQTRDDKIASELQWMMQLKTLNTYSTRHK